MGGLVVGRQKHKADGRALLRSSDRKQKLERSTRTPQVLAVLTVVLFRCQVRSPRLTLNEQTFCWSICELNIRNQKNNQNIHLWGTPYGHYVWPLYLRSCLSQTLGTPDS